MNYWYRRRLLLFFVFLASLVFCCQKMRPQEKDSVSAWIKTDDLKKFLLTKIDEENKRHELTLNGFNEQYRLLLIIRNDSLLVKAGDR